MTRTGYSLARMQDAKANACLCRKGESVVRIGNAKSYSKQEASSSGVRTRSLSGETDVVAVSQLAPKDVLSPKQRSIRPKARPCADLVRLPFEEIRRCRQTSSFVTKRLLSKSCRQSLRALLVWPVEGKGEQSRDPEAATKATWLILPVVICLSQRLSHACLSINFYTVKLRMAH